MPDIDADLTLRIEHASGEVSELIVPTPTAIDEDAVTLSTIDTERALDRVARCEAVVFREEWIEIEELLDRRNDELFVLDEDGDKTFGGRLDDWQFSDALVDVQIDSFERDALDVEPPASFERDDESDADIAADIIDLMPDPLQAGDIDETTSSIDYDAAHKPPGVMLRELAESTGAEIEYHPDGTVDYTDRRGADRDEPLSPLNGSIIETPRIRETVREEVTNVRAVSRDDASIFEEATAINTDSDERQVWVVDEIDSTSSSRLQSRATRLANEYAGEPEYVEVETTVDPLLLDGGPNVGDRYALDLPAYGIETDVRVIEADRSIDARGERVSVLLSNRKLTLSGR